MQPFALTHNAILAKASERRSLTSNAQSCQIQMLTMMLIVV